jgi:hypothetical protein
MSQTHSWNTGASQATAALRAMRATPSRHDSAPGAAVPARHAAQFDRQRYRQHYRPATQQAPRWLRSLWLWF